MELAGGGVVLNWATSSSLHLPDFSYNLTIPPISRSSRSSVSFASHQSALITVEGSEVQRTRVKKCALFSTLQCNAVHCSDVYCIAMHCSDVYCSAVQFSEVLCTAL